MPSCSQGTRRLQAGLQAFASPQCTLPGAEGSKNEMFCIKVLYSTLYIKYWMSKSSGIFREGKTSRLDFLAVAPTLPRK